MAEAIELKAWRESSLRQRGARAERREGRVPGILYGDKRDPETISVEYRAIERQLHTGHFLTTLSCSTSTARRRASSRATVQLDPVSDRPVHVDFLRLGEGARARRHAGAFKNQAASPGLKSGGVLNIVRHEIECAARPTTSPIIRGRSHRAGHQRVHPHLRAQPARGREADHPRARLHRRHHRRAAPRDEAQWPRAPPPRLRRRRRAVPRLPRALPQLAPPRRTGAPQAQKKA